MSLFTVAPLHLFPASVLPLLLSLVISSLSLFFQLSHFYSVTILEAWVSNAKLYVLRAELWESITNHQITSTRAKHREPTVNHQIILPKAELRDPTINHQIISLRAEIRGPIINHQISTPRAESICIVFFCVTIILRFESRGPITSH